MRLCIVEDDCAADLFPLSYFSPVYDLRCGILSLRERIVQHLRPKEQFLHTRSILRQTVGEHDRLASAGEIQEGRLTIVNGRVIMDRSLSRLFLAAKGPVVFHSANELVGAILDPAGAGGVCAALQRDAVGLDALEGVPRIEVEARFIRYPWDLIYENGPALAADAGALLKKERARGRGTRIHGAASLISPRNIVIGKESIISAGVVIDASEGPVVIGDGVRIYPNAVIEGPCFIGKGTQVKIGAQIYGNTSIGPFSKIGGELEHVIVHGFANKQHDGFLGHAYLCPWVNLGAGTVSSNLKNTYGTIRITVNGRMVDTGKMFLGLLAGDHAKTGINVTLNTGTVLGPGANVFGSAMPPKYVPGFSWGGGDRLESYDVEKALAVAETVMRRRSIEPTDAYRLLFREVHALTSYDRANVSSR